MSNKYDESEGVPVGCSGCGGKRPVTISRSAAQRLGINKQNIVTMPDENMVLVTYIANNRGNHPVYGNVVNPLTGKKFFYGYRGAGAQFLVHKNDVWRQDRNGQLVLRGRFIPVEEKLKEIKAPPVVATRPLAEPQSMGEPQPQTIVSKPFNFQTIPGVTKPIAREFEAMGLTSVAEVKDLGLDGLQQVKGIGQRKAEAILRYLNR